LYFFFSFVLQLAGTMVAQQYGIGGAPWVNRKSTASSHQSSEGSDWGLDAYFASTGRPNSPALASDLTGGSAGTWFSIGAPYIAVASDWLPLATNWWVHVHFEGSLGVSCVCARLRALYLVFCFRRLDSIGLHASILESYSVVLYFFLPFFFLTLFHTKI
jgi:hypothetical protein